MKINNVKETSDDPMRINNVKGTSDDPMKRNTTHKIINQGVIDHFTNDPQVTSPDVKLTSAVSHGSTYQMTEGNRSNLSLEDLDRVMEDKQLLKHLAVSVFKGYEH